MKKKKLVIVITAILFVLCGIYYCNLNTPVQKRETGNGKKTPTIMSKPELEEETAEQGMVSDAELFEQAKAAGDWATIEKLGNKGYSKAYYPLALHYYNIGNILYCEKWSRMAIKAGVQTEAAKKLLNEVQ